MTLRTPLASQFRLLFLFLCLASPTALFAAEELQLPSPHGFLESYDPDQAAVELFQKLTSELGMADQLELMNLASQIQQEGIASVPPERITRLIETLPWKQYKEEILRLVIYRSEVVSVVPQSLAQWRPLVYDFMLFFLHQLPEDRLTNRVVGQLRLLDSEDPGRRLLALIEETPSLQKIGQILARYPTVPDTIKSYLQVLENGLQTMSREELVEFIRRDVGEEDLRRYEVSFDDRVLAEATVGAVIAAELTHPGEEEPIRVVCKIVKPQSVEAIHQELEILNQVVDYFERYGDYYRIGKVPLAEMFRDVRDALREEIRVVQEQEHLAEAARYYSQDERVEVPAIHPLSTENVTFMDFLEGGKIVEAYPGRQEARSHLAKRLNEVMTVEVIFAEEEQAIFHGDPHTGNVFHSPTPSQPYRIGLLDWGLRGVLTREARQQLIQLMLGIYLDDEKRVKNHLGVILRDDVPTSPSEKRHFQRIALEALDRTSAEDPFDRLSAIILALTQEGYSLDFNLVLFIKSQVTLTGLIHELDPEYDRSGAVLDGASKHLLKELPKRLLYTVYFPRWTSHDHRTMVSNEDLRDVTNKKVIDGLKTFGGWIWTGVSFPFRGSSPSHSGR